MSKSAKAGVIAITAVALGLGLVGCGSDTKTATSSSSATTTTTSSAAAAAPNAHKSIADYIKENGITEAKVTRGEPGAPTITLPFPPGWQDAGPKTPDWAYGAIVSTDPAFASDPPNIIALVSKLSGNVDPAKIIEFAPGEIQNLPGYEGGNAGQTVKFAGFDAVQIGGMYNKNGTKRAIAQKTVVIPGKDALYVLQLNADGTEDQMPALMDATKIIDDQTTITP